MTVGQTLRFAQALVDLYEQAGFNGFADELTWSQLTLAHDFYYIVTEARAFIAKQQDPELPGGPPR